MILDFSDLYKIKKDKPITFSGSGRFIRVEKNLLDSFKVTYGSNMYNFRNKVNLLEMVNKVIQEYNMQLE